MLKLLGRTTSGNVQKALWLLDELGLPYEHENIGGPYGKNNEPAYLRLNPNGVVPTLIDGDFVLWESNAVLRYLCDAHGGEAFYPRDLRARARVEQWLDWQTSTLAAAMIPLFQAVIFQKRAPSDVPDAVAASEAKFAILNAALGETPYAAGNDLSIADMALGSYIYRWFHFAVGTAPLPHLRALYERLAQRPAYRKNVMVGVPNFTPPSKA